MALDESAIGTVGVLIIGTRGPDGPGEVWIRIRGGSERFLAWSEDPLPKGAKVLVIDFRGARTVDVVAWSDPLGEVPRVPGAASCLGDDPYASPPAESDGDTRGDEPPHLLSKTSRSGE